MNRVEITNEQDCLSLDVERLRQAAMEILAAEFSGQATISLAVVDDPTIHRLNREYLAHDYPTDVLSFPFGRDEQTLDGEVVVSAETALAVAPRYHWSASDELLLYVIHGVLHLVGYDDKSADQAVEMRERERFWLERLGHRLPAERPSGLTTSRTVPGETLP